MRYTVEAFPPTTNIEVIHNFPVDKKYLELGELSIRLKRSTEEDAVLYLIDKAKEIGADAIVIIGERHGGSILVPAGEIWVKVDKRYLKGVAIKYE